MIRFCDTSQFTFYCLPTACLLLAYCLPYRQCIYRMPDRGLNAYVYYVYIYIINNNKLVYITTSGLFFWNQGLTLLIGKLFY